MMNPQGLVASAGINMGLAIVVLSLFSILKKQPSNAPIYYARRLSLGHRIAFDRPFSLRRFLPSLSWILSSTTTSQDEDDFVRRNGLDALIIIRLFKLGIKFFGVCCLIGMLLLLPINYNGQNGEAMVDISMDSFTISNIPSGSNSLQICYMMLMFTRCMVARLWAHFACLWFISFYGFYLLYKEYKEMLCRRIQRLQEIRHRADQFTILVRGIPLCTEHHSRGCCVDHFFSRNYPSSYNSYQMLYDGGKIESLVEQANDVARKIEVPKKIYRGQKHYRQPLLSNASPEDFAKVAIHEEQLRDLSYRICQQQCEDRLKQKELPVAFVIFKSRMGAALAAQSQQHLHPLMWTTEVAPEPKDVSWNNLAVPYRMLPLYKLGVVLAAFLFTVFFAVPVTAVQGIAKYEKLKKWFPPARAIELIPGLSSIVTGYLPSAILNGFIYLVPFAMLGMAKLTGCISRSKEELRTCNMVFYFLMGNVFFLSLLSGSLLDELGASIKHPKDFPSRLARAVSAQGGFFITYILTDGMSGFSFEILQPGLLSWDALRSLTFGRGKEKNPYLFSLPYYRIIPVVCLAVLIGMVYAVVAPLLLPFLICYFCLGYVVYINQIEDVYETLYETCGKYWPYVHHYILIAIILMQITMIGLFGLKSKPAASISTVPLLLISLMFAKYCQTRFYPTFRNYPIESAAENDELDRKDDHLDKNYENAKSAYCPPFLHPVNLMASGTSST